MRSTDVQQLTAEWARAAGPGSWADLDALLQHIPNRLSDEARAMLSAPFSLEELEEAAKGAPNGRTPGPDGIPAELC